jgi:hypothetical protein
MFSGAPTHAGGGTALPNHATKTGYDSADHRTVETSSGAATVCHHAGVAGEVLEATRRKPSDGSAHWSCRKLPKHLKVSKEIVQRIWHKAGLKPHRLERYMASDDPDFERTAADIIALYLSRRSRRLYLR